MINDKDPDFDDIDALLSEDAMRGNACNSGLFSNADAVPTVPIARKSNQSQVDRLIARATHISSNLRHALTSICDAGKTIERDRETCNLLTTDLESLDYSLARLEATLGSRPTKPDSDPAAFTDKSAEAADDSKHEESNSAQENLAKIIEAQQARISALESQLKDADSNTRGHSGQAHTAGVKNKDTGSDPYVNRLIITSDEHGNLKFPLDKNIMTIGRESKNDIPIRSRFISRFHARIVSDHEGAIIEDLDSRNGVTINSHRIRRQQLRSGDLIDLGRTQLKFIDLTEGSAGEGKA